jgi:hypothetical protein
MKLNLTINLPLVNQGKASETKTRRVDLRFPDFNDEIASDDEFENEATALKIDPRSKLETLAFEVRQKNEAYTPAQDAQMAPTEKNIPSSLSASLKKPEKSLEKILKDISNQPQNFKKAHSTIRRTYALQLLLLE